MPHWGNRSRPIADPVAQWAPKQPAGSPVTTMVAGSPITTMVAGSPVTTMVAPILTIPKVHLTPPDGRRVTLPLQQEEPDHVVDDWVLAMRKQLHEGLQAQAQEPRTSLPTCSPVVAASSSNVTIWEGRASESSPARR